MNLKDKSIDEIMAKLNLQPKSDIVYPIKKHNDSGKLIYKENSDGI